MDALGWAFLGLVVVMVVSAVLVVPLLALGLWDIAQRRRRAARDRSVTDRAAPACGFEALPPSRADRRPPAG